MKVLVIVSSDGRIVKRVKIGRMEFIIKLCGHNLPNIGKAIRLVGEFDKHKILNYKTGGYDITAKLIE